MKGIYKIQCCITGVIYIGSATVCFNKRWKKHRQRLRNNYHENSYLQNAWNKYGQNNFKFNVVEDMSDATNEMIKEKEVYWISQYFPKGRSFCFNLSDHTFGGDTLKSDDVKKKHSESLKAS